MKNRKLYQLLMASVISATVLTSGIGVSAADFSDSAVETSVSEDETPVAEESEEFSSDAAEAASANEPDSAVPEAFYDNTLGKRLGGGLLAVGIQGGEGLSA